MENKTEMRMNEVPASYTLKQIEFQKEKEKLELDNAKKLFIEYIDYYKTNYPKSNKNKTWIDVKLSSIKFDSTKDFKDIVDSFSETDLNDVRTMLSYSKREIAPRDMKLHEAYLFTDAFIKRRIPGIKYIEKLETLTNREKQLIEEKTKLMEAIEKEKEAFKNKPKTVLVEKKKEAIKPIETTIKPIEKPKEEIKATEDKYYICPICLKDCKSGAGLSSHKNTHPI